MQRRNKTIFCFCLLIFITLMCCCTVASAEDMAHNTTTTHTQNSLKTIETTHDDDKIIKETEIQDVEEKQNKTNAKVKTINKVSNNTKSVKTTDVSDWSQIGLNGTYTLTSNMTADSVKKINSNFVLDGNGHTIFGLSYISCIFNATVGQNVNVTFKNVVFEDQSNCNSIIWFASSVGSGTSSKSNLFLENVTFNDITEGGSYGIVTIYSTDSGTGNNFLKASFSNVFFNNCKSNTGVTVCLIRTSGVRSYTTFTNVQYNGQEVKKEMMQNVENTQLFTNNRAKQLICFVEVQNGFVNATTTLNVSLYNQTYFNSGTGWGNLITPQVANITFSLRDSNGNYLRFVNGTVIKDIKLTTNRDGIVYIQARFPYQGIYTFDYDFPATGEYLPVHGSKQFVIQGNVTYDVPDNITKYYNEYPSLWVNVTNSEGNGITSPEGSTVHDTALVNSNYGVVFYIYNNSTDRYDSYVRPVIDGEAVFSNASGWVIPDEYYSYPQVAFPEGYYYSFNITSKYLGDVLYTNSTNKTTTVYVLREPTSVTIQNITGEVSGMVGEDIQLMATVRDPKRGLSVDGQNVTFVYNNRVLARATITNGVATTTVKINESITNGQLYAYFNDTVFLNEHTHRFENSSNVVTLNIRKRSTVVEATEQLSGYYNNNVKIVAAVKDDQNNPITEGVVTFKKGDVELQNVTVNSTTGVAEYNYHIDGNESVIITSYYNGTKDYESSSNTTTITRLTIPTNLTIIDVPGNIKVAESFNFKVKLTNITGQPVSGQVINVTVNGVQIPVTGTTNNMGEVTVSYTPSVKSNINIVANYYTDYLYDSNNTSTTISSDNVELIDTVMGIIVPDNASVAVPFTFKVNLTNATGDAIPGKMITVSILGESATVVYDSVEKLYVGTYTPTTNDGIRISASTTADNVYKAANAFNDTLTTAKIGLIDTNLTLSFSASNKALNPVTITVGLTNRTGQSVGGRVTVYVNGQDIGELNTATQNTISYTPMDNTTLRVYAVYNGDRSVYAGNTSITYDVPVDVLDTVLTVNLPVSGVGVAETFEFTVSLNNSTGGQFIGGKSIVVEVNGVPVTVMFDSARNAYVGTYRPSDNSTLSFVANFAGDNVYGSSTGNNVLNGNRIGLIDTRMGIIVPEGVDVSVPFTFKIKLTNTTGDIIGNQNVLATVNTENVQVVYNATSMLYEGIYTPRNTDNLVIRAHMDATNVYNGSSAVNNTLTSDRIGLIPTLADLSFSSGRVTVNSPLTVTVSLTNASISRDVIAGNVKVYVNGVLNKTVTINDNSVSFTYTPNDNETLKFRAVYDGDNIVYAANTSAEYEILVDVINTTTKINVPDRVKVNESFNFTVRVNDSTGSIGDRGIRIIVNNHNHVDNLTAVYDPVTGLYNATYAPYCNHHITIRAEFDGDTVYAPSNDINEELDFNSILLINTEFGIEKPESVNVSDIAEFTVNLTDENGYYLDPGDIEVLIDGQLTGFTRIIDENNLIIRYETTHETTLEIELLYNDEMGTYNSSFVEFYIPVVKVGTTTYVEFINNTAGNVSIRVWVTGDDNTILKDGNITVRYFGELINTPLNQEGNLTLNLVGLTEYGSFKVHVEYSGNTRYAESMGVNASNTSQTIDEVIILPENITFTVTSNSTVYVTENVTIKGKLLDGNNNPVSNRVLIVKIIDEEDNVEPDHVTTDSMGEYTYTYHTTSTGNYRVNVTYGGSLSIEPTTVNTTFVVNLIPTNTIVDVANNTAGNFTISVNVTDNRMPGTDNRVTTGRLIIVIDDDTDNPVYHNITDDESLITLDDINNNTSRNVKVTYEANNQYNTSSSTITVMPDIMNTHINLTSRNTTYNGSITIEGILYDDMGAGINTTGLITFTFNNTYTYNQSVTSDNDGKFNITLRAIKTGSFMVTASFDGITGRYDSTSASTNFNVNRMHTNTEVIIDSESSSHLAILFRVLNDSGAEIPVGSVQLIAHNKILEEVDLAGTYDTTTRDGITYILRDYTEEYLEQLEIHDGITSVLAVYTENENYTGSNDTFIGEDLDSAHVTVKVNATSIFIDEKVNITVNITDGEGNPIRGHISIKVNNETIEADHYINGEENGIYSKLYNNTAAGEYTVTAILETALYPTVENSTTFTISKIPTRTNVSIHNNSWGNSSIDVIVYDARTNTTVTEGNLSVTINNLNNSVLPRAVTDEITNIVFETQYANTFRVTILYLENDKYLGSEGRDNNSGELFREFEIFRHNTTLTVTTDKTDYDVDEEVIISGYLIDVNTGRAVNNSEVELSINNHLEGRPITNNEGYYTFTYKPTVNGTFNVSVHYAGASISGQINNFPTNNNTTFNVDKIATVTNVKVLNNTYGNVTISVTIKEEGGLNVSGGSLSIRYGDRLIPYNITGNETVIVLPDLGLETYTLNVSYNENYKYLPSNNTENSSISVEERYAIITVERNTPEVYVNDEIYIHGTVTDAFMHPLDGEVILTFIDEYGDVVPEKVNLTKGFYYYYRHTEYYGPITVVASYINTTYKNSTATTNYNVIKIPTNTTVEVVNNTIGNIVIRVNIVDKDNRTVPSGTINITDLNGILIKQANFTDGEISTTVPSNERTTKIQVIYVGDNKYVNSTGKNATGNEIIIIETVNQTARINLTTNQTQAYIGQTISINLTLYDGMGMPVTDDVTLTFTGEDGTYTKTVRVIMGKYGEDRTVNITGTVNVTASYEGNGTINPINTTTTYVVDKIPTSTSIEVLNDTVGNLTIKVVIQDTLHETILEEGNITIEYARNIIETKINDTETIFNLTVTNQSPVTIKVNYTENATHAHSYDIITTGTLNQQQPTLTITAHDARVDDNVTISGFLLDGMGKAMAETEITFNVNGTALETYTQADGSYTVTYHATHNGTFTANATFAGNSRVAVYSNTTTFNIRKVNTTTSVAIVNNTLGNVQISVNVTDEDNHPVTEGYINLTVDNHNITVAIENAENIITINDITTTGKHDVSVEYLENTKYINSTGHKENSEDDFTEITVINKDSNIVIIEIIPNHVPIDYNVTIEGYLHDVYNNPIRDAEVNLTFIYDQAHNDSFNVSTGVNGNFTYTKHTEFAGPIQVIASYDGNDTLGINPSTSTPVDYIVDKRDTVSYIELANNTMNNLTYKVWFTDKLNGSLIREGSFTFIINNTESSKHTYTFGEENENITFNADGTVFIQVDSAFYEENIENYAYITYESNEKYNPSNKYAGAMLNKKDVNVIVTVDKDTYYINEQVTFNVKLVSSDGMAIAGDVNITVGNTSLQTTDEGISITQTGQNFTYRNDTSAFYNILVEYFGSGAMNPANGTANFTLIKYDTQTIVNTNNDVYGNVSINVQVNDTVNNKYVHNGTIRVTYANATSFETPVNNTGDTTIIPISYPEYTTTIGLTVEYLGDYSHMESSNNTNVHVEKQNAILTVHVNNTNPYIGDEVLIYGQLINPLGQVSNKEIYIVINSTPVTVMTNATGHYNLTYDHDLSIRKGNGTMTVTVERIGNESVYPVHNTTNFTVYKLPTNTTINIVNNTVGNVQVNVTVTDVYDRIVNTGTIEFYNNAGVKIAEANITGENTTVKLPINDSGDTSITGKYLENNVYLNSTPTVGIDSPLTNITIINHTSIIKVSVNTTSAEIGQNVTINGTLLDEDGNSIDGENIVHININGIIYHVNVTNGQFKLENIEYTAGIKSINATYDGNTTTSRSNASAEYNVTLIPTKTVMGLVNTTVGNVIISVNVTNKTGETVNTGELQVIVNDEEWENPVSVNQTGETFITILEVQDIENVQVSIIYKANNVYNTSRAVDTATIGDEENTTIIIKPTRHASIINAVLLNTTVYAGQNITIRGTLILDNGTKVDNENVTITIGNIPVNQTVTDGNFEFNYTTAAVYEGRIATIRYDGTSLVLPSETSVSFNVTPIPTNVVIEVTNTTAKNVTIKLYTNDTVNNQYLTRQNTTGTFTYYINGEQAGSINLNDSNYREVVLNTLDTYGVNARITVEFNTTNSKYLNSTNSTSFIVTGQNGKITLNATPNPAKVGETVTITGTLTDDFGQSINGTGIILIEFSNGYSERVDVDANGKFSTTFNPTNNGTYNVSARFRGNNQVLPVNGNTSFTVNKIPTTTRVELLNNTVGNVTIKVTVKDNETNPVTTGQINITIDDTNVTVNITGEENIIKLNITDVKDDTSISVEYLENNIYLNSTGYDNNEQTTFHVETFKQNATITVTADPEEAVTGHLVVISGTLFDGLNNPITGDINLTFNGMDLTPAHVEKGYFSVNRISHITGEVNVTAWYLGNGTINPANDSFVYRITKVPTQTYVQVLNNTMGNITLSIRFIDDITGSSITTGSNFTVTVLNVEGATPYRYDLDNPSADMTVVDGRIILKLDDTFFNEDSQSVNVTYQGNETYSNSSAIATDNVLKDQTGINLTVNDTVYINQTAVINVTLMDSQGHPFGATVNITVGEDKLENVQVPETGLLLPYSKLNASKVYTVTVEYPGNKVNSSAVAQANITVNKIPTNTSVTLLNNTYGNVTIKVSVKDVLNDKIIRNGTVIITMDGIPHELELNGTTDETVYNLSVHGVRNITTTVKYNGSEVYMESYGVDAASQDDEFNIIEVMDQVAVLTVAINPDNTHVGNTSIISGKLVDGLGNNISGARIDIDVNGTEYHVFTDEYGEYTAEHIIIRNGTFTVNATWNGNSYIDVTQANTTLVAAKVETTSSVAILDNSAGNVTLEINVTDMFGEAVTSGNLLINITGHEQTVPVTGENTHVNIMLETAGEYDIKITFLEDDKYLSSTANDTTGTFKNITVGKQNVTLTVDVVRDTIPVGTYVYITGKLLNASGEPIVGATVNLTFNGLENTNVTTVNGGLFNLTRLVHLSGEVEVTANYSGNEKYNSAENKTGYNATKLPTNTTMSVLNATVDNVMIDVEVWDMYHNTIITNGTLNVTVNNKTSEYNLTGPVTVINLNITNTTAINISVLYTGNETYENSTAVDRATMGEDEPTQIIEITPAKQNATLTIVEGPSPVYVYNNITYNGTLVDGLGRNITGKINITIKQGEKVIEFIEDINVTGGVYSYTRPSSIVGEMTVTAEYQGNDTINPVNATTTYTVNLRPTVTLVNVTNNTAGNVNITVQVLDALNNTTLDGGNFTVKVHGQPDAVIDINDTIVPVKLNVTTANEYLPIAVIYDGNTTYDISSALIMDKYYSGEIEDFTNITVELQVPTITMDDIPLSWVGDTVNITGNLKDGMNQNIIGRTVTVEIGETVLTSPTDANGNYKVSYTPTTNGTFTATASIRGNSIISNTSTTKDFNVIKLETTTNVEVLSNIAGNVTILVNVTSERGNIISIGEFRISIDEVTEGNYTIAAEETEIILGMDKNGTYKVNVTYLGDNKYASSQNITNIDVIKQNTTLTVGVIRHEIPIGTAMIISGTLLNATGMGVGGANIILTFNDQESVNVTTIDNGYYTYTRNTTIPGYVTVNAYYNGSRKYNNDTDNTHYTVFKLDTNTTVRVINSTIGKVLVDVVVYDMYHTGLIIENGTLNVTVNNESTLYNFTSHNTTIPLNVYNTSTVNVTVVYLGNATYMESTGVVFDSFINGEPVEFTNITPVKQNATITLEVNGTNFTVLDAIRYNGSLTDGLGQPIEDILEIIITNGTETIRYSEIEALQEYDLERITNMTGTVNVTVKYAGNDMINPAEVTKSYVVDKRETSTMVEVVNNTIGNLTISVEVSDAHEENRLLENGVIAITTAEGTIYHNLTGTTTNITVPVSNNRQIVNINVRYTGNGTYHPSTANTIIDDESVEFTTVVLAKHNSTLTVNTDPTESTVGSTYNISGYFKDVNGTGIVGAELTITVNHTRYTTTTNEEGYYSINYTTDHEGEYTVTVTFNEIGSDLINATSNTTTFTSNKIPTKTTVDFVDKTQGKVTISVNVTQTDETPITTGTLNITVGEKTVTLVFNEAENIINLKDIGLNINSTTPVNIKIEYLGNDTYINSTGKTITGEELQPITADKEEAKITVSADPNNITVEKIYDILGTLTDIKGNTIPGATINITVRNTTDIIYSVNITANNETGRFQYTNNTLPAGTYTINASFISDDYNYTSAQTTLDVNRINTTTEAYILNKTSGNITVRVIITDITGYPVTTGNIIITDSTGETKQTATLEDNYVDVVITSINTNDTISLTVNYEGTDKYMNSSNSTALESVTPETRNVVINAIPVNTTFADTTVKVNITDAATGDLLINAPFNITDASGKNVGNGTTGNDDGNPIVDLTIPVGLQTLTITYPGNSTYTQNTYEFTINVTKRPSKTSATILNATAGNVTLRINITDAYNTTPVTSGNITITDKGIIVARQEYNNETGTVDIKTNITTSGKHELTVTFEGNTNYTESTCQDETGELSNITIKQRPSTTTASTINTTAGNTIVHVNVTDTTTGKAVTNGTVEITTQGGEIVGNGELNSDGIADIITDINSSGNYTLTAIFKGNENYYGSNDTVDNIEILPRTSNLTVTVENNTYGNTTINITLVDGETGEPLNGTINITLPNGTQMEVNITNGSAIVPVDVPAEGGNITITYPGDGTNNETNTTITIKVDKRPSSITADIENSTVGNVTLKVNVTDKVTGQPVTSGYVNITWNGQLVGRDEIKPDGTGLITTNITSPGKMTLVANFEGNDKYNSSYTTTETVDVTQREPEVTVKVTNNTQGNTTIEVQIVDPSTGEGLDGNITVTLPNGTTITVPVDDGKTNVTIDAPAGNGTITVTYPGNQTYEPEVITIPVTIEKRPSSTSAHITNTTAGNVTVQVKVTDKVTAKAVQSGNVVARVNNTIVGTGTVDKNGNAIIHTNLQKEGNYNILVIYEGNTNYTASNATTSTVKITPRNTTVTATITNNTQGESKLNITLKDTTTGNPVNGSVIITLPNGTNMTIKASNGSITVPLDLPVGTSGITVTYPGDGTNNATKITITTNITKRPSTTKAIMDDNTAGNVTIKATITDSITGKTVTSGPVSVTVNGTLVGRANVNNNGVANIKTTINKAGNYTYKVTYEGNANYTSSSTSLTGKIEPKDIRVKVTVENNTVSNTTIKVNITDTVSGKPVANEKITVTLPNGTKVDVTTDKNGVGYLTTELPSGENTLIVNVEETDEYEGQTITVKSNIEKVNVNVQVDSVIGTIGETITLTAHVTDEYGKAVTGGNLVFKLNGRTLRTDGRFDTNNASIYKISVKNGLVTITMTADLYLRSGKNITASYSGSYKYLEAKGNVAIANIRKRNATMTLTATPKLVKQDQNILFTATVKDNTANSKKSLVDNEAYVMFKVNGNTLKDSNGSVVQVKVVNGVAKYTYRVPLGTSGIKDGKNRDYIITAVYSSPDFYPNVKANATFNVERSTTRINVSSATVKDDQLSIRGSILDQYGNNVLGTNHVSIKINGKSFAVNGKYTVGVKNGVINISGINLNGNKVKTLTIVTGERQAYTESSVTITDVKTV